MVIFLLLSWLMTAFAVTPTQLEEKLTAVERDRARRQANGPPVLSMSQMKRTADGAVVTGLVDVPGQPSKAYGAALIDVPIAKLWAGLNDETRHPGYTAVSYAELVAGRPCVSNRKVLQYLEVAWPVGDRWWVGIIKENSTLRRDSGGAVRELYFTSSVDKSLVTTTSGQKILSAASPIGSSNGGWFLVAIDERHTYVEYYVQTDPGGRVPGSLASTFATKGVRDNIAAIQRFAKEGNPSCPIE